MVCGRKDLVVSCRQRRGIRGNCLQGGRVLDPGEGSSIPSLRGRVHPNAGSGRKGCSRRDRASPGWEFGCESRSFDLEDVTLRWTNANGVGLAVATGRNVEGRRAKESGTQVG